MIKTGQRVVLCHEPGCIVPAGTYTVSKINPDGSFHVGGNTAVWPRRVGALITDLHSSSNTNTRFLRVRGRK